MPRGRPFKPGQSGNPKGRPAGRPDRRSALRDAILKHVPAVIARLVAEAKKGDVGAAKVLLDRVLAPLRPADLPVDPPLALPADMSGQGRAILAAVADGRLTPDQAATLMATVAALARALETAELAAKIAHIEEELRRWEGMQQ
jgi:hypothetical protein